LPYLLKEYQSKVKLLEPDLRMKGEEIGRGIISEYQVRLASRTIYLPLFPFIPVELIELIKYVPFQTWLSRLFPQAIVNAPADPPNEMYAKMQPWIQPVLTPFIHGIKQPFKEERDRIIWKVKLVLFGTAFVSGLFGYACGVSIGRYKFDLGENNPSRP
jgi:hypothetical protein